MEQFYSMCDFFGWEKGDTERDTARESLKDAVTMQFNSIYGTDVNDLKTWRNLCQVLGIDPIPEGLKACRDVSVKLKTQVAESCTC